MRALPICLLALMLSGCSMLSRSPVEPVQSTATPPKTEPAKPKVVRPAPVRIITKADELVGKPMQINAAKMKANAVLLHSCEVTSGTPGCYRQAVCIGSALNITAK